MSDVVLSLYITLAGMGLVFGAILLLWGLMYLLPLIARGNPVNSEGPESPLPPTRARGDALRAKAAAAAVALALAEQGTSTAHPLPPPPTSVVSPWQLGMRTRQMQQKSSLYRKENR